MGTVEERIDEGKDRQILALTAERDTARAELARIKYELHDLRKEVPLQKRAIIEMSAEIRELKAALIEEKALRQRLLNDG